MKVLKKKRTESKVYQELLKQVSGLIQEGRRSAVRQVNTALIVTYWLMGQRIVDYEQGGEATAQYGESLLKKLANDLTEKFGRGFSERNLEQMRLFYMGWPISQTLSAKSLKGEFQSSIQRLTSHFQLSWSHYCLLMRISDSKKRSFYEGLSSKNHWSVRQLDREVQAMLYERTSLSKRKQLLIEKANKNPIVTKPEDEIKDSYVLEFLNLKDEYSESDLEDALISHLERFLLELGYGFAFVARQKRFRLEGDEFLIDLVFYHISLECYVLIELKLGKFKHYFASQMNLYLNWTKNHIFPQAKNDPIGIVLCADKKDMCAKYAIGGMSNRIFVSKYQLKLPKPQELKEELKKGQRLFFKQDVSSKSGNSA